MMAMSNEVKIWEIVGNSLVTAQAEIFYTTKGPSTVVVGSGSDVHDGYPGSRFTDEKEALTAYKALIADRAQACREHLAFLTDLLAKANKLLEEVTDE